MGCSLCVVKMMVERFVERYVVNYR